MTNAEKNRLYRAYINKDSRLDGHIFAGITSTGIYCRPICPSPQPKPENVIFFPDAAHAENAGFRACKRCRPDARQGSPAWMLTEASVARAIRLMSGPGDISQEELAQKLGMSTRHLRRLFIKHTGLSPNAFRTRARLKLAENLLKASDLAITDIAYEAGFGSLRRFHGAWRAAHDQSPGAWRSIEKRTHDYAPK